MAEAQSDQGREQQRRNNSVVLAVPSDKMPAVLLAEEEGALRLAVVASEDTKAATGDSSKPVYYRDLFPGKAAPARRAEPGQRVEVYEGSDSRSTYVR